MKGIKAIIKKELADHFSSYRFLILFALIAMVSLITVQMAGISIRKEMEGAIVPKFVFLLLFTSSGGVFSLVQFVAFFGPLVGLILGFDTINRERNEGTLSKVLAQPIYRDVVINGKFLAGVSVISIMLLAIVMVITGLGIYLLGVIPGIEEIGRVLTYLVISIVYISFWLGIAILFSILFRSTATSALAALAVWIFFSFFVPMGINALASALVNDTSVQNNPEALIARAKTIKMFALASPMELYSDASGTIIDPMRKSVNAILSMGPMEQMSMAQFAGPLLLSQSLLIVAPYVITLISLTMVCFAISYVVFMRQEIRSI